jgi:F-type H+-transporting ATPase subunit delta
MMNGAVSKHYASALADSVFKPNSGLTPEEAAQQFRAVDSLFSNSKPLEHALLSPAVKKTRKEAVVARLADELGLHRLLRNFLLVVVSHRRTADLPAMRREFEAEVDRRLGWVPADITSARELSAKEKEQVERALGTRLGKFIRAHYSTDPSLLGGVRARAASQEYDASILGRLEQMRRRLLAAHQ